MIIVCIISFIIGAMIMFIYISISASLKEDRSNKVHFYVVRDSCGMLELWLGFPRKSKKFYISNGPTTQLLSHGDSICEFGLKLSDYDKFTFNDRPKEVFLNLED